MIRFLPEWTETEAILMAFPDDSTDWNYILEESRSQYEQIIKTLTEEDLKVVLLCRDIEETNDYFGSRINRNLILIKADFNDTWTRDYGPLTVIRNDRLRALDFGFNGWGLKFAADKDNLVNLKLSESQAINLPLYRNERDFILEGGSIDTDGEGTILTTTRCLCSPNRNGGLSKIKAAEQLHKRLGADHILFLDYGWLEGDDTDSHIDTLARMAPGNTIIFTGCNDENDSHFEELLKMKAQLKMFRNATGEPFNLIELPLPDAVFDEDGKRLPATYANYLVTDQKIFIPTYNQPAKDNLAIQMLRIAFPDHKAIGIPCLTLLKQHGSLHCATMQIPEGVFNSVIFDN